jgi:hypothetical protein
MAYFRDDLARFKPNGKAITKDTNPNTEYIGLAPPKFSIR